MLFEFNLKTMVSAVALSAVALALPAGAASAFEEDKPKKPEVTKKQDEPEDKEEADKEEDGDADKDGDEEKPKKKKQRLISDMVEEHDYMEGLFKLYRNPENGQINMEIREDQIGKEFIYFSHIDDGIVEGGHFRGQFRSQKVFKIERRFDKIVFIEQNPYFYFDPENNLSRAQNANISNAVFAVQKIRAHNEDDTAFLINADNIFLSESFEQVKPSTRPGQQPGQRFSLGKLSRGKSRIADVRSYPENTSVTVDYVYSNPAPVNRGSWFDVTDARNVTVTVQHTLVEMPENDFKPRFDDARVGYFLDYVNDQTSQSATPWRDMINRWHLVKKDPEAEISEPVEPIVWWIENTTPEELRPIIQKAAEAWNPAFEASGFRNAIQVKIQPDDAEWDAGDIRYNVLRWTSSPRPPFGGYGPSFSNPRTGQILAADIMLEYAFLTNRLNASNIFETAALPTSSTEVLADLETDSDAEAEAVASFMERMRDHARHCEMGAHLQMNTMLGKTLNLVMQRGEELDRRVVEESIYYLILHEIGHTLGLNHNMKATQARTYETTHDISAQEDGLAGSVMDYPSINFAPPGRDQAYFYPVKPGPYDIWAIQFGYDPDLDDEAARAAHLARSADPLLTFGNDADDMRSPGRGIDPRVNIYDMTDDAVKFAEDRLKLAREAIGSLRERFTSDGKSYQELRNAYLILTADMLWQGRVTSRYIGGVYIDRSLPGQDGAGAPYTPVDEDKQRQAMQLLRDYIFGPDAFAADPQLLRHLAIQRRGFMHGGMTEDPKLHGRVAAIQADILNHILHPATMQRITDTGLYGNSYNVTEMLGDLTDAIFEDDNRGAVNTHRQELQIMYVKGLIRMLNMPGYNNISRSNAFSNLKGIRNSMARWRGDAATRAHRDHISFLINKALEVETS